MNIKKVTELCPFEGLIESELNFKQIDVVLSDDKALLDIGSIHDFLCHKSYWAKGRTLEAVRASIENSYCVGVYLKQSQIGFARIITDYVTFADLCLYRRMGFEDLEKSGGWMRKPYLNSVGG